MACDLRSTDHAAVWVANLIASKYGDHIINVRVEADTDNGKIVSIGEHIEMDIYKEDTYSGDFEGIIEEESANGNWYIRVLKHGEAFMLYNVPIIEYEFNKWIQDEIHFYNAEGDAVRAFQLHNMDRIEASELAFEGVPETGKKVTVGATGQFKVGN